MQTLWQDLRYTLRQLRNAPVFALTAILTLALGLGATTAMLAIVDSVLVRPVALPHAERIVDLRQRIDGKPDPNFQHHELAGLEQVHAFESVAGTYGNLAPITTRDGSRVDAQTLVSPRFFVLAGVAPRLGRTLTTADTHTPVAVVNDRFWNERLHGDPHALGSVIKIQDRPFTVVGVMPPGFDLPEGIQGPRVYTPLVYNEKGQDQNGMDSVYLLARLKPGVTLNAALQEARAVYAHGKAVHGEGRGELLLRPYRELLVEDERPALLAALGACLLILLISCANAANLQIARGVSRASEMRVREALGASRARLARQIATESVALSMLGAALGFLTAYASVQWARNAYSSNFARFNELAVNPAVFLACTALALLAGLGAAFAPAWKAARGAGSLQPALAMQVSRRSRLSGGLVALQIAFTCVLLLTAGLFIRSYRALAHAPFGFDTKGVTAIVLKPNVTNPSPQALEQVEARIVAKLASLPGVDAAASEMSLPYSRFMLQWTSDFFVVGETERKRQITVLNFASPNFTRTLGLSIRRGRGFIPSDSAGSQPVCLVSEAFVHEFFQGTIPLGRAVRFANEHDKNPDPLYSTPKTIVGVIADEIAYRSRPVLYIPDTQIPVDSTIVPFAFGIAPQFAVRSSLPQPTLERELRSALRETAPEYAEMSISPIRDSIEHYLVAKKLALRLATGFGLLALVLAAIGIYGVLAYSVAQRTREIGIRMALGSTRQGAMRLVLRQAAVMVAAGLTIGLAGAWPAGRAVRSFLYGVTPLDPLTLAATALVLLLVCACAAAVPAYRATQVDPIEALRNE